VLRGYAHRLVQIGSVGLLIFATSFVRIQLDCLIYALT
jgi:hypothetical protein